MKPHAIGIAVARKEFKVEEDHNQFKCHVEGCGKGFRKEKLLHSHLKHYHPEAGTSGLTSMSSSPTPTPSLTEAEYVDRPAASPGVTPKLARSKPVPLKTTTPLPPTVEEEETVVQRPVKEKKASLSFDLASSKQLKGTPGRKKKIFLPADSDPNRKKVPLKTVILAGKGSTSSSPVPPKNTKTKKSRLAVGDEEYEVDESDSDAKSSDQTMTGDELIISEPSPTPPPQKKKGKRSQRSRDSSLCEPSSSSTNPTRRSQRQHSVSSTFMKDFFTPNLVSMQDASSLSPKEYAAEEAKPIANTVFPFWDARTVAEVHESDEVEELVNCCCDLKEESGLMIQCEVCLTWQHGMCFSIDTEEDVPESYVCFICKDPKGVRESQRFAFDQEWLKKGKMAAFSYIGGDGHYDMNQSSSSIEQMLSTNQLVTLVLDVVNVLHSLRYKLQLLKGRDDDVNLKLWETSWLPPKPSLNEYQPETVVKEQMPEKKSLTSSTSVADVLSEPAKEDIMLGEILSSSANILEIAPLGADLKLVPDDLSSELKIDGDLISFLTSADPSPVPEVGLEELARTEEELVSDTVPVVKDEFAPQTLQSDQAFEESRPKPAEEQINGDEDSQNTIVGEGTVTGKTEIKPLTDAISPDTVKKESSSTNENSEMTGTSTSLGCEPAANENKDTGPTSIITEQQLLKTCRENLLEHIIDVQRNLVERLSCIEKRVKELESEMGFEHGTEDEDNLDLNAFKSSVKGLYKDLDTIMELANM